MKIRETNDMKILTSSEIAAWKSCPMKWYFRYHEELVPNTTPLPLSYGRMVHEKLESFYAKKPIVSSNEILDPYTVEEVNALVRAYLKHEPFAEMGHVIIRAEEEFRVPLRSPSGRKYNRIMLSGKIDLETLDQYLSPWIADHKTSAMKLNRDWLTLSDQMGFYLWAKWQMGDKPVGIIYNLLRKPVKKPHQGETSEEWGKRLEEDIATRPEFYFQREAIVKGPKDLMEIEHNLWDLAHTVGKGPIIRNPGHCQFFGCPYREICVADTKIGRNAGYRHERAHVELSEEVVEC